MSVDVKLVKQLREETGAAVLDCKKALEEHSGDLEAALEYLNERGLAKARKKAGRETSEGRIEAYVHTGGRVGVMVEVNCETDFVGKTDEFQELARDITLHIAATRPSYITEEEIPAEDIEAKKEEYAAEAKEQGKPDDIVEKIVEGKLNKWYDQVVLMRQPFVKDDELTLKELLIQSIAELGENIQVRRFAYFEVGEDLGDEETDEE